MHDPDDRWYRRRLEKRDEFVRQTVQRLRQACARQDLALLNLGLANLRIGNAVHDSLISALEEVNRCEAFFEDDDNSAGGLPRPLGPGLAGAGLGDACIAVIRKNQRLPSWGRRPRSRSQLHDVRDLVASYLSGI